MKSRLLGMAAAVAMAFARPGVCSMASKENLDDILGGGKADKAKPSAKPAAGKPAAKAAPAKKPAAKAAPAKGKPAAKPKASAAKAAKGEGKYYFPKDSKEFTEMAKKMATVKKQISSKDLAAALKTETWKVRLVAVALEADKKIKIDRKGKIYQIGPR